MSEKLCDVKMSAGGGGGKLVYVDHNYIVGSGTLDFTIDASKQYYLFCHGATSQCYNTYLDKDFYVNNGTSEVIHVDNYLDNYMGELAVSISFPNSTTLRITSDSISSISITFKLYVVN